MKNRERGILTGLAGESDQGAVARGVRPVEPFGMAADVDALVASRKAGGPSIDASVATDDDEDEEN
jgi:hypothetical protein